MAKLHPLVQKAIQEAAESDERADVMMSTTTKTLSDEQRAALEALEGRVRSVTGPIITLDLPTRSLAALCDLDFAKYIELARPMQLEKKKKKKKE